MDEKMKRWSFIVDATSTHHGRKMVPETEGEYVLYSDHRKEIDSLLLKIKELELRITVLELPAQNYNKTLVRAEQAEARIKELEKESLKNKEEGLKNFDALYEHYQKSEVKVKKLEEGIKKHKDKKYGLVEMRTGKIIAYADFSDEDKELYKLIEKK